MTSDTVKPGEGIVRFIGWRESEGGSLRTFEAVITFPNGPPDLPLNVVWKALPVTLALANPPAAPVTEGRG